MEESFTIVVVVLSFHSANFEGAPIEVDGSEVLKVLYFLMQGVIPVGLMLKLSLFLLHEITVMRNVD